MADSGYIGSKLSLISKSDIRYVGTLQNVDTQTSSITLEQVQSFGTEGRRGHRFQDEIPPSDTVFEYIVFRGADVKDLQVFEAPSAPQAYALPYYATPQPYFYGYPMPILSYTHPMTNQQYPMYPSPPLNAPSTSTLSMVTQKPEATDDVTPTTLYSLTDLVPDTMTKVRTPLVDDDNSHLTISKPDTKDSPSPTPRTTPENLVTTFYTELDGVTKIINDLDIGEKGRSSRDRATTESDLKGTNGNSKVAKEDTRPNKNTSSGNRNVKRKSKSKKRSTAKHPTLQQEFDFASSNAKFNKDTNDRSSLDAFYDKKKSFFDNISCDAKEKTETSNIDYRKKHQNEKQLNFETFGPSSMLLPRRKQARQGGRTNSMGRNNGKQAAATTL